MMNDFFSERSRYKRITLNIILLVYFVEVVFVRSDSSVAFDSANEMLYSLNVDPFMLSKIS